MATKYPSHPKKQVNPKPVPEKKMWENEDDSLPVNELMKKHTTLSKSWHKNENTDTKSE